MPFGRLGRIAEAAVIVSAETEEFERQVSEDLRDTAETEGRKAGEAFSERFSRAVTGKKGPAESLERGMRDIRETSKDRAEETGREVTEEMEEAGERAGRKMGEGVNRGAQDGFERLQRLWRDVVIGGIVGAAVLGARRMVRAFRRAVERINRAIQRGGEIARLRDAFESLATAAGVDPVRSLEKLQEATRNTISEFELMQRASTALQAGLPATGDELAEIARLTRRLSQGSLVDANEAFERFINGVIRGRRILLDDIGIIVSFQEAHKKYAESVGKSVEELTEQEKIQARLNEVLTEAQNVVARQGEEADNAALSLKRLTTRTRNFRNGVLELLAQAPQLSSFLTDLAEDADDAGASIEDTVIRTTAALDVFLATVGQTLVATAKSARAGASIITSSIKAIVEASKFNFDEAAANLEKAFTEDLPDAWKEFETLVLTTPEKLEERFRQSIRGIRESIAKREELTTFETTLEEQFPVDETSISQLRALIGSLENEIAEARAREGDETARIVQLQKLSNAARRRAARIQREINEGVGGQVGELREVENLSKATAKIIERQLKFATERRDVLSSTLNVAKGLKKAIERQRNQAPDLPEGVSRMELGGVTERVRQAQRELEPLLMDLETNAADVLEVLDRWGISLQDIRDHGIATFADLSEEVLNLSEEEREAREEQEELVESFEKMAAVTSGITQAADAMGELDDETRAALQSITALAQAGVQFAKGNFFAGAVQAGGALANIIGTLIQAESEREQVVEENTLALLRLRSDVNALRKAMLGIPGDLLAVGERLNELVQQIPENFGELSEHVLPEDRFFGTEDEDIFGEPEATGGEVEAFLDRLGISFTELETLAQQTGVSIENLTQAIEEGEAPADAVRQELIDLNEAMKELRLDRLFEGFRGQMSLLETRFDLLEEQFDSSAAKLEELRELFLEFVELPGALEEQIGGADLETPEGRRQFEEAIQRAFELLASGELEAADLGGLTPQQFQDMLTRLDDLVDQTEEEEGTTRAFQVSREITETTASRLVGIWQTAVFVLRDISRSNRGIMNAVGGEMAGPIAGAGGVAGGAGAGGGRGGTPNLPTNPPSPPPSGPTTFSVEVSGTEIDVDLSEIDDPAEFLDEIGRITGGEVDRALERAIEERRRAHGEVIEER